MLVICVHASVSACVPTGALNNADRCIEALCARVFTCRATTVVVPSLHTPAELCHMYLIPKRSPPLSLCVGVSARVHRNAKKKVRIMATPRPSFTFPRSSFLSQCRQDRWAFDNVFSPLGSLAINTFVEFGARDGRRNSNRCTEQSQHESA